MSKDTEPVIKNLPTQKTPGLEVFIDTFYKILIFAVVVESLSCV